MRGIQTGCALLFLCCHRYDRALWYAKCGTNNCLYMPRSVEADGIAVLGDERVNENFVLTSGVNVIQKVVDMIC